MQRCHHLDISNRCVCDRCICNFCICNFDISNVGARRDVGTHHHRDTHIGQ